MMDEQQRLNMQVGNAIRFQMLILGAEIRPTQFASTIYALGGANRYAQLEFIRGEGYKLRLKWYKTRQVRTSDPALMDRLWRHWRPPQ